MAHDQAQAFENGLLIHGSVVWDGKPVYTGPDKYLAWKYERKSLSS